MKKGKDKYRMISFICGNVKYDTNELTCETETDSQTERTDLWLPRASTSEFKSYFCYLLTT